MSMLPCVDVISCLNLHPLKSGPPEISVIQREFRRNEGSTDYATIPAVTLAGDQRWEFDVLTTQTTLGLFISGERANNRWYIGIEGGKILVGNASDRVAGTTIINDGRLHHVVWQVSGGIVSVIVDDILQYSNPVLATLPKTISRVMSSEVDEFFTSGIIANLKIYDNGTLVRDYPINDGKNILANAATALGSEIDGLTYALTTAIGGVASVVLTSLSVIGKTYLVEVSYSGVVGDASVRIGGFSGPSFTGTGTIEFVATATTTVNDILGALTGVTSGSVTVSIKEAVGYGTIINGNADDWGLFDKQANGDWLGQELVVNGGFEYDISNWTAFNSVISHHPNSIRVDDSANAGNDSRAYQDIAITNGIKCRFKFSQYPVSDGSSSYVGVIGSNFPRLSRGGNGDYSEDIEIVSGASIHLTVNGTSIVDFSKVSLKEVLKNA